MENINIGGKTHKVSKAVKEHIEFLLIQLRSKEILANQIEKLIEELEDLQRSKIGKIEDCLAEVKKNYC